MALDRISALWMGNPLSIMEKLSIASFLQNGHGVDLYVYGDKKEYATDVTDLSDGVTLLDANSIIPEGMVFKIRGGYSSFSDFFRWKVILDKGGWWADTDTICLKPFNFDADYVFVGGYGPPGSGDCVSSGMFKAPKGSPVMQYGWDRCMMMEIPKMVWGQAGPPLFTEAVHAFDLTQYIISSALFFPVYYTEAPRAFIDIYVPRIAPDCYSIHLFNEMWRLAGADKNATYPSVSLYEQLKRRFLEGSKS
jgi:hypothetical protein